VLIENFQIKIAPPPLSCCLTAVSIVFDANLQTIFRRIPCNLPHKVGQDTKDQSRVNRPDFAYFKALCHQTQRKVVPDPKKLARQIRGLTGEPGQV
jgi:hypothetical protein